MKYPKNLKKGSYIGTTAPSEGITKDVDLLRLDNVKNNLEKRGYNFLETKNVRICYKVRSSNAKQRAKEFMDLWENKDVNAIISAGGGEFLVEMLDELDFEKLKNSLPKWFQGYSDNTGITFLLTTICDIATIYGPNVKDFGMRNLHKSLEDSLKILEGNEITQSSFEKCENNEWTERTDPYEEYNLKNDVVWKNLNNEKQIKFKGRSIGGSLDVIKDLIGTKYDKVKDYIKKYENDGIIWFLEICEMSTPCLLRTLWQMKNAGYFENCNGIIFGRSMMLREDYGIGFSETVKDAIGNLKIPIIYDADIGHVSPQIPIVSGAILEIQSENGKGTVKNYFL